MKKYILALDQGTTSSRAVLFDKEQNIIGSVQKEITQHYPRPGYVEHDPMEIFSSQCEVMSSLISSTGISAAEISAIGITNQRETTIVWDKNTGKPVYNAIVWQCRRTAAICEELKASGLEEYISDTTGLIADAYFSATKIKWILDNVPGARQSAEKGDLIFGTVDTWLIWNLTGGKLHIADYTNASRTMLFDIHKLCWDEKLLKVLNVPLSMMPEVRGSSEIYGYADISGTDIPIAGIAGDQQASLFGQVCFESGDTKNTYGTGCFMLMNTGKSARKSKNGLLTTIAASKTGDISYALEGSVFTGGSVIQWLRDELGIIKDAADSGYFAAKVKDTGGVYIVPAFTGLGAPYWDMYARGTITGITRGTNRNHIIRAAEEAIAYQCKDLLDAIQADSNSEIQELKVDGGASNDDFLMQFQSDISGTQICRPAIIETTALGAAYLAGLAAGFWENKDEIKAMRKISKIYSPQMDLETAEKLCCGWHKAVNRSLDWAEHE